MVLAMGLEKKLERANGPPGKEVICRWVRYVDFQCMVCGGGRGEGGELSGRMAGGGESIHSGFQSSSVSYA